MLGRFTIGAPIERLTEVEVTVPLWLKYSRAFSHTGPVAPVISRLSSMSQEHSWSGILGRLVDGSDLSIGESSWAMRQIMAGEATPAQLAGFLVALNIKGETVDEVVGLRDAALEASLPLDVDPMALDIVGTGGDPFGAVLNISSAAAIVAAASGVPVVKHGNRAASSASGSSDVLAVLGLNLEMTPERVAEVFRETGITFAFAAVFHPGFRFAGPVRKELGVPTVFNILGPLCNPARPEASAVGVASLERVPLIVGVFQARGATALVYRGDDGIDKLTTTGHSHIWEVSRGTVAEHDLDPRELGIARAETGQILGENPENNAAVIRSVLAGDVGPARDIVLLNAAAGLASFELARDPEQLTIPIVDRLAAKLAIAAEAIDSGSASAKLDEWVAASHR
jgi:anthranilate phosphoribosyltransferase